MPRRTLVLLWPMLALMSACGATRALPWDVGAVDCATHSQCESGEACVMGVCTRGRLNEPMSVEGITAPQWYDNDDGSCRFDEECGPWVCDEGACVSPDTAGITLPDRREFAYWDLSCSDSSDCGSWFCVEGFCHALGRISPSARPVVAAPDPGTGVTCFADGDCGDDGECMYPGYCHEGRGGEPMTWVDVDARGETTWADLSCNYDTDCGPHVCHQGWCRPHEMADRAVPLRGELRYFDGSCIDWEDCGPWECWDGYCHEPGSHDVFRGDPDSGGLANTNALDGVVIGALGDYDDYGDVWDGSDYDFEGTGLGGVGIGGGRGCLANLDCASDEVCVHPGVCESGRGDEPFDLSVLEGYVESLGVCLQDSDCGPWACDGGDCVLPPWADQTPPRRDVQYYDFSCIDDADCGSFRCGDNGWCLP